MRFTDGKAFVLDEKTYGGFRQVKKRLHCALCDHDFVIGDYIRWIYANGTKGTGTGNFFVCRGCDNGSNGQIIEQAKASLANAIKLARQWNIYGPDWERDIQLAEIRERRREVSF